MKIHAPSQPCLLSCAVAAAKAAGQHALQNINRRNRIVRRFRHDVKLRLDLECQAIAEKTIRARFPSHTILGEESSYKPATLSNRGCLWIIDPIDGTVNFSHGLPLWCSSVAVLYNGRTLAGAVYAPVMNELYTATANGKSARNGSPVRVSAVTRLKQAIVQTGLDKNRDAKLKPLAIFEKIALHTQKARIMGSAAYDICQVAAGHSDGYFEKGIFLWDVAAAGLIVEKAGGCVEYLMKPDKNFRLSFIASNGHIHSRLKKLVLTAQASTRPAV